MAIDAAGLPTLEERAGFTDRSACGRLWITGADALDLLNRLTTNRLETLPEGLALSTVLTNGDARVIDHLRLAAVDGGLWCLTSPGRAEACAEWIDLYTFGEDIAVEDVTAKTAQLTVAGPLAADALKKTGHSVPDVNAIETTTGILVGVPFGAHSAYEILMHTWAISTPERQQEYLEMQKSALRRVMPEVSAETFEAYRIAQGVPAYGAEFGAFNNPLEARLLGSISDDKGCYTGQEVIARLQTYRKVQRLLMSFTSDAPAAPGDALESEDGSPAGVVTSGLRGRRGRVGTGAHRVEARRRGGVAAADARRRGDASRACPRPGHRARRGVSGALGL